MIRTIKIDLYLILTVLLLMVSLGVSSAEVQVSDLKGEDREMFDRFRDLLQNGQPDDFYAFAKEYEADLRKKGYNMLYYKLKNNEGFYALRHNMIYRAMRAAEELDAELRRDGATKYYYLATGLMGDIYYVCHDRAQAEKYFVQALDEVGDEDPKFTMRLYQSLAEMLCLKDAPKALDYTEKAIALAKDTGNDEYLSLSLAMRAYIQFLEGNSVEFFRTSDEYEGLRSMGKPDFSHRYDNVMEIARRAFNGDYDGAIDKLKQGQVYVDSSLVAIRIYAMERNIDQGFLAMKRRYLEMDSLYSIVQDANFDQMVNESALMKSREEAAANKKMVSRLTYWMIGLTAFFLFAYIMGRRRLFLKLRAKSKDLRAALAHAEESDRMKSAFISNMSHEIRTPLNAVSGFSQLLCQTDIELGEEEKKDMQERITSNVELITSIVNELLELSKSESESNHHPDSEMADVWVNQLCRGVLRSMVTKAQKGVETRFATNVADDFTVRTHAATIKRILTHLLGNAQKFTEQGHIELRCTLDSNHEQLRISVTDTGPGIAEKDRERIFDLFEKANDNFKEGVGLGLPICRRLASSIGGEVTLDASYTSGSRFLLTIPYVL